MINHSLRWAVWVLANLLTIIALMSGSFSIGVMIDVLDMPIGWLWFGLACYLTAAVVAARGMAVIRPLKAK